MISVQESIKQAINAYPAMLRDNIKDVRCTANDIFIIVDCGLFSVNLCAHIKNINGNWDAENRYNIKITQLTGERDVFHLCYKNLIRNYKRINMFEKYINIGCEQFMNIFIPKFLDTFVRRRSNILQFHINKLESVMRTMRGDTFEDASLKTAEIRARTNIILNVFKDALKESADPICTEYWTYTIWRTFKTCGIEINSDIEKVIIYARLAFMHDFSSSDSTNNSNKISVREPRYNFKITVTAPVNLLHRLNGLKGNKIVKNKRTFICINPYIFFDNFDAVMRAF
jgi:hypothetical protein